MVAIVDYGVGNLFSLRSSLASLGVESIVTGDASELRKADRIILPGVGAFGDAADKLCDSGLFNPLKEIASEGKPLFGICLGMQLLFERGFEFGEHAGLGLIAGDVLPMAPRLPRELKIPQIGWNALTLTKQDPIFSEIKSGDFVYFVHSFYAETSEENIIATTDYGFPVTAAVRHKNVCGCQFHPEKSGETGLKILKAFCETKE